MNHSDFGYNFFSGDDILAALVIQKRMMDFLGSKNN